MARDLFIPQLVQPFGTIKNTDLNTNLALIQQAFNSQSAFDLTSSSYSFGATGNVVNLLVDLSQASGDYLTATLPASPAVGDPPITIVIAHGGTNDLTVSSCVITTGDGSAIMGVVPGVDLDGLPFLSNTGDSITLAFIGGTYGWAIISPNVLQFVSPIGATSIQPWDSGNCHVFHRLESVIDTTSVSNVLLSLKGINHGGLSSAFTIAAGVTPVAINTTSGSQTFNGIVGAYNIPASPVGVRHLFTCVDTDIFVVTT